MIGLAKLKHGLYHLQINKDINQVIPKASFINNFSTPPITNANLWHFRLGHLSGKRLNVLHSTFSFISKHIEENCDVCHLAKQKKLSYSPSINRASKPFDLVHMDIWGPFSQPSIHGHKYFLTIVDDFSYYTWIVLLRSKGEVRTQIQNFIVLIDNQFQITIKRVRSNNGLEFFQQDNKMVVSKENINIFLMLLELLCFNLKFQNIFGHMLLNMLFILLIESHHP